MNRPPRSRRHVLRECRVGAEHVPGVYVCESVTATTAGDNSLFAGELSLPAGTIEVFPKPVGELDLSNVEYHV